MGITPITNLLPLPQARNVERGIEPLPMERVENSSRAGDETYSPSQRKPSRGSEDDASDDEDLEDDCEANGGGNQGELTLPLSRLAAGGVAPRDGSQTNPISFFA